MSSFKEASGLELAYSTGANEATAFGFGSLGATHPEVPTRHASSDDDHLSESAPALQDDVPARPSDYQNRWCVNGSIISTGTQTY